ncbi:MAG: hypothetical protein M3318_02915 [Actinomycetota bacterium]|nr:hypothetical protein [Actinomycetota bacterium]
MGGQFNKWWLLPFGILTTSALIASSIIIFGPTLADSSFDEVVARHGTREPTETNQPLAECSGALGTDHACYQQRYESLVRDSGVEAAFAKLKDEFTKDEFVNTNCHHLTHIIGRAATELYSDVTGAYSRGDNFCASGYYHGVIEATMATLGADEVLDEADNICADLRESQNHSFDHRNCLHGLGHGSMYVLGNELFKALQTCDALTDEWERDQCSGGVFMENINTHATPGHTSNYLKADQPFHPCPEVKTEYKTQCYARHTEYALKVVDQHDTTVQDNFAKVFDLCAKEVEDGFRPACYSGLGHQSATEASSADVTDGAQEAAPALELCMLGQDNEALYYCIVAAARQLVFYYDSEAQAKELCKSLTSEDLRAVCLQRTEEQLAKQRYAQEGSML